MIDNSDLHKQDTDFEIIEKLLPYLSNKTFIDIGAEKGFFAAPLIKAGLTGVLFEPLNEHNQDLQKVVKNTESQFYSYAIDSVDRTANFHIACDENDKPLDYFHSLQKITNDTRVKHNKSIEVQCRSLNSLLKEGLIEKNIGILKTDTEGNDLHVLQGMSDIQAEVLICEYFMPGIYAGWEEGHPKGLIEEAKKLGFNHFVAIKRIFEYEFLSLDNYSFCEKQWGNLIFISDELFEKVKFNLELLIKSKEQELQRSIICYTETLQNEIAILRKACDERNQEIFSLKATCNERIQLIERIHSESISLGKLAENKLVKFINMLFLKHAI
jgi:FkbM family methyltransferase